MDETTAAAGESENKDMLSEDETEIITVDTGKTDSGRAALIYGISDQPPWIMSFALALQHFSSNFTSCIVLPILLSKSLCFDKQDELLTKLIATSFFTTGIGTMLQVFLGCRLPILQGPSAAYLIPLIAMLQVRGDCPEISAANTTAVENNLLRDEALIRIREVQGVMMLAALVQCILGFTGLIGTLLRFIGPITIGVTIFMIGVGIIPVAMNLVEDHWCISIPTISLVILFSMFLSNVSVPFPGSNGIRIFALFPMMLAIAIMWFVCVVLTLTGVFPDDPEVYGYAARVDTKVDNIRAAPWLALPYPGQWGMPTFNVAGFAGVLTAVVASMLDSLGDYHACSQVSLVPPPPLHAVNRGIGLEGIGCMIGALWGAGVGVTSHSSDISVLNLTKVASRTVLILSGLIFAAVAFLAKFSALMNAIPSPVLGASAVTIGMISAIGLANFQHVNMESSRNILVVGISIFVAIGIPGYFDKNPEAVNTGIGVIDQLSLILLSNKMFMGAAVSVLLDNLIPGTYEDRGMDWRTKTSQDNTAVTMSTELSVYQLPFGMRWIQKKNWMRYVPFSPTFTGFRRPYNTAVPDDSSV
ncbi:solute carrier family 23 member 2-like [Apostichopus japonicus]|uniref:solute carrier family 23 member 2-like n=1 Tax=Stichopus japonicus TaxID=307972 RepID=UPI003AB75D04